MSSDDMKHFEMANERSFMAQHKVGHHPHPHLQQQSRGATSMIVSEHTGFVVVELRYESTTSLYVATEWFDCGTRKCNYKMGSIKRCIVTL